MRSKRLLWGVAALVLTAGAAGGKPKVEYMVVMESGRKIGHARKTRAVVGKKVTTEELMVVTISRAGTAITMRVQETSIETTDGKPLGFKTVQDLGIMKSSAEGTVRKDGTVEIKVTTAGTVKVVTMTWPKGALMAEGIRLLSRAKGLKQGTTYSANVFSGALQTALRCDIEIGPTRQVDLFGRKLSLTEVGMTQSSAFGSIKTVAYVDKEFNLLKSVTPMAGMKLEMIACTRQVALSKDDVVDFFDKLLLSSPTPLKDVRRAKSITYELKPTSEAARLRFLRGAGQSVRTAADGTVTLTVRPPAAPKGASFPYKGKDKAALAALKPTRYLQADDPKIKALAARAAGKTKDPAQAARRIEAFVRKFIDNKNLSVGYATAAEVATAREGDCTEHAVLSAALCRAGGIPAQVVTGLAYVESFGGRKHIFVPHAWFRAYVGGKWISFDAAMNGYDAGHIALTAGKGDPEEFFSIVSTLGNFKIASVKVEK